MRHLLKKLSEPIFNRRTGQEMLGWGKDPSVWERKKDWRKGADWMCQSDLQQRGECNGSLINFICKKHKNLRDEKKETGLGKSKHIYYEWR